MLLMGLDEEGGPDKGLTRTGVSVYPRQERARESWRWDSKLRGTKSKEGGEELKTVNINNFGEFRYKGKQRNGAVAGR